MRQGRALAGAVAVAAVAHLAPLPAQAEPPVVDPAPPLAPVAPPPLLERRSAVAVSVGTAAVAVGGLFFVSAAFSGGLQAACDGTCHHVPTVVGLIAAGGALVTAGVPLIVWGARMVPVAGPAPAVALVPRQRLPAWASALGSGGFQF